MFKIVKRKLLNETVVSLTIEARDVARKAKPGQFIILRVNKDSERIPLTVAGFDREKGLVDVIFQIVGSTTFLLSLKKEGESIEDFLGPLGKECEIEGLKKVLIVSGGVGSAIALPVSKELKENKADVTNIVGFRSKELLILEDEFKASSNRLIIMTDDGSYERKGNVTLPLRELLEKEKFDMVFTYGPLIMMKFVVEACKEFNAKCMVSMNPIMIDGTGMCGGCRLTLNVDGKKVTKFACVDGPDFNGYEVDFDEAMSRGRMYSTFERHKYEEACNLFKKGA